MKCVNADLMHVAAAIHTCVVERRIQAAINTVSPLYPDIIITTTSYTKHQLMHIMESYFYVVILLLLLNTTIFNKRE